jgi:transposase-like protein
MRATIIDRSPAHQAMPSPAKPLATVLALLNEPAATPPPCPSCRGRRVQRWGQSGGVQRFRCTACGRSFNALTGTPLARLRRRDLWLDNAQVLNEGLSIRAAGRRLGIHHNTTFR